MSKDKKRRDWSDDFWAEDPFDEFIRRFFEQSSFADIFRELDEMFRRFMSEPFAPFPSTKEGKAKRYVWGFSITIGPDGRPIIKEFGNIKPTPVGVVRTSKEFEPLSTVYEEDDKIKVIVDIPGAKKETIRIDASEKEVEVWAEGVDRKYYKKITLPESVDPDTAKARYENGILEIVFEKKEKGKKKKEIKVE